MAKINFKFKAVIFDMDGVITNTMPCHFQAWAATFKSIGIKVNCYDIYKREGQAGLTSVKEILREHGRKINPETAGQILAQKEKLFKRIVKIRFVKGSRGFIKLLKKRNFLLGLVTGTSRHEVLKIMPKKLLGNFDVSVTGDEVKKGKPHPEPFARALKKLNLCWPDAVVLENAPLGIEAAKNAGLFCIALETSLPRKYLKKADFVFKSYPELIKSIHFK